MIKLGICGEHGGDPSSVEFLPSAGIDYGSCLPYRAVLRLAAAQAALTQWKRRKIQAEGWPHPLPSGW